MANSGGEGNVCIRHRSFKLWCLSVRACPRLTVLVPFALAIWYELHRAFGSHGLLRRATSRNDIHPADDLRPDKHDDDIWLSLTGSMLCSTNPPWLIKNRAKVTQVLAFPDC